MQDIREALDQCLIHAIHIRNLSPTYVESVRLTYASFLSDTWVRWLPECTALRIEQWLLDGRIRKRWGAATFHKRHKDIGFLFRYLKAKGIVETDPTKGIDRPKLPQKLPKGIAAEQAERLIDAARRARHASAFESVRNTALVALMLFTGLRRAEVAALMLADVDVGDLGDPARDGFANAGGMVVRVVQGKWKKDRVVPVSTRLAAILSEYLRARSRRWSECPSFFVSARDDVPMTGNSVRQVFRRLEAAVGFKVSPHMLRHTFATLMLEGGCDLHTLMKLMGHTEIKTTSIYLDSSIRLMASSIERHPLN